MAVFNFKTTEDSTPGGGVYKVGTGNRVTIKQSDYPNVNLASMTAANFFKKTSCNGTGQVGRYNDTYHTNICGWVTGGATSISYSYANGVGTVTVNETLRGCKFEESDLATYTYYVPSNGGYQTTGYTHTIYMSRDPLK